ncbi:MAG: serine hydrolase [Cyclobacteriaceae bacterium]
MRLLLLILSFLIFTQGCKPKPTDPIDKILSTDIPLFQTVLEDPDKYELQVIYTQIDRDSDNHPAFTTYRYEVDENRYFYPASTVKMPVAFLALEKLNQLSISGLDRNTAMFTDSAYDGQTRVLVDSTSANLQPSIAHYIKKIFLVSDNEAFNRLYEFVGQETINKQLKAKGFTNQRLQHRLSIALEPEQNRHTNPINFRNEDSLVYHQEPAYNPEDNAPNSPITKGVGYIKDDSLILEPMDFSNKNFFSLVDLHEVLQAVIFPEAHFEEQRFQLTENDYRFLYQYMSQLPGETTYPNYPALEYYDSYVKFFMYGDIHDQMSKHIRIFNKVGLAYGYLIDVAYIVDFENQVEFLLSAVIHVNENQIYNDGVYEYDSLGIPFLATLGRQVYEYEKLRTKQYLPDLTKFKLEYDQ